ncbi:MAG: hypothetical protein M3R17_15430 [Bacteroidota bacterium]|nr:hypothetical protein [Bacteroidota bacterium]
MNNFSERFNKHSNSHLLKIIESKGEYQLEAISAAITVLENRHLTEEEMNAAKADLAHEQFQKNAFSQKKINIANELKDLGDSVIETIHPVKKTPPTADKLIKVTVVIFGLLFLYTLNYEFGFIKFMFTDHYVKWDLSTVLYLLPLLWVPIATVLFYKHKKAGWILLMIYTSYSLVCALILQLSDLFRSLSTIPVLDDLLPKVSPLTVIATFLFFGGSLLLICKANIREVYSIDKKLMFKTIAFGAVLAALHIYLL